MDLALIAAAASGGKWVQLQNVFWEPTKQAVYNKTNFCIGVQANGVNYLIGSGFTHRSKPKLPGIACETCSVKGSLPCAAENTMRLAMHAFSYLLIDIPLTTAWERLSFDANYGAKSGAFYIFVYDYAGVCVAHGANKKNIGRTLWEIIEGAKIPVDGRVRGFGRTV